MTEFDDIRPYNDDEVSVVLKRLMADSEFLDTISKLKFGLMGKIAAPILRPFVKQRLQKDLASVTTVSDFQSRIESYFQGMLSKTVDDLSVSGLENLEKGQAYLFISNHRDIAMDPAFVNWTLYQNGFSTLRIAIGDNLLTKPFSTDLMRLNKSFIVNRSAKSPREKLKAAKLLSKYIHHSVVEDNENIWIAQREGRAKDGIDKTNPAIVSMLALSRDKKSPFEEYIRDAKIVPVAISYEYDPCDSYKARELAKIASDGAYTKGEHEDIESIAKGITGYKGRVHLSFGSPFGTEYSDVDAVTDAIDLQIHKQYVLQLTNCFAYEKLEKKSPMVAVGKDGAMFNELKVNDERQKFERRIQQCPEKYQEMFLRCYANPVYKKLSLS